MGERPEVLNEPISNSVKVFLGHHEWWSGTFKYVTLSYRWSVNPNTALQNYLTPHQLHAGVDGNVSPLTF